MDIAVDDPGGPVETEGLERGPADTGEVTWVAAPVAARRAGVDEKTLFDWCEQGKLTWRLGEGPYGEVVQVRDDQLRSLEGNGRAEVLPAWIEELAEGWKKTAATEAELAYLRDQLEAIKSELEDQRGSDDGRF
ncbi:MAG TPA: hypothetical protein VFS18_01795, partial [Actinomycetota bacterium]|nr:hypothetical protein [Actinomycetota bacterium]